MIGSVWGLLLVGLVLASSVMVVLWYVQVRIGDASHVDVAWAVLIACAAILYALLADGDMAHRVLAAVLASVWGFRLGAYLFLNRILGPGGHHYRARTGSEYAGRNGAHGRLPGDSHVPGPNGRHRR
jgi:steroid 5-alpha reductase family enzyme